MAMVVYIRVARVRANVTQRFDKVKNISLEYVNYLQLLPACSCLLCSLKANTFGPGQIDLNTQQTTNVIFKAMWYAICNS